MHPVLALSLLALGDGPSADLERWPLLPRAIASFGAASDGSWLYAYGGHIGNAHEHSVANATGEFFRLNLLDGGSCEMLTGGPALQSSALVSAGPGSFLRIGGMSPRNGPGAAEDLHSVADVARFDAATGSWKALPPLPEARSSHDAVVIGTRVYVAGGWTLHGSDSASESDWLSTAWVLDFAAAAPRWEALPDAPFQRRALALASSNGKLVALGGIDSEGEMSSRVDLFDPEKKLWSRGPDLPGTGFGAAALEHRGRLYATVMEGTLLRLAENGASWERVGELVFPRFFHRLVSLPDGRIAAVGGAGAGGGHLRVVEPIETAPSARTRIVTFSVPFPGTARNRQGVAVAGNELLLFGGNRSLEQHDFAPERFSSEAWSLHLGSLALTRLPDMPAARQSMSAIGTGGAAPGDPPHGKRSSPSVLLIGGFGPEEGGHASQAGVLRFDVRERRWTNLGSVLPGPRTQTGLAMHAGTLRILGGLDYDSRRPEDAAFKLTPRALSWACAEKGSAAADDGFDLAHPRRAFGGAQLGSRYYLVGGMCDDFEPVTACDVLDLETDKWSSMPSPRAPRISPELVALGGKLYLAGGSSPTSEASRVEPNETVEVFDPATGKWSVLLDRLPMPARHMQAKAFGSSALLFVTAHDEEPHALRVALVIPAR